MRVDQFLSVISLISKLVLCYGLMAFMEFRNATAVALNLILSFGLFDIT